MPKRVLIISPYFPPVNAADMHRVRTSLPYFAACGWSAEVVTVHEDFGDIDRDPLFQLSLPPDVLVHRINAFQKKYTSKVGLGSIALRSLPFYARFVNNLLKAKSYDLIFFSTTQFPVCILGPYWKRRFDVPYVIDFQDPWHSNYYKNKATSERPPKYWFSYHLNKYLEPLAVKATDGLISVSANYITELKQRYPQISGVPSAVITFGAYGPDVQTALSHAGLFPELLQREDINIVYIGRGGADMHTALSPVFESLQRGLRSRPQQFSKLKFYFIGTSYAPAGQGVHTILPLARRFGVAQNIVEMTDRISYYHAIVTLMQADALFIPGSDDPQYTASKLFPYLLVNKPIMAVFNRQSSAIKIMRESSEGNVVVAIGDDRDPDSDVIDQTLRAWAERKFNKPRLLPAFEDYSAEKLTLEQTMLFDKAIAYFRERKR